MQISDFYEFGSKLVMTTVQAHPVGLKSGGEYEDIGDSIRLIMGEFDAIYFPVTFKQEYGDKFRDVLDTGHPGLYLISDHMQVLLKKNNLTGWKTFPIRLLDKKGNIIEGYQGLSVIGKCGPIDISKSEIIKKRIVPNGPLYPYFKGIYVGLDEWDGSDFFIPKYHYGPMITAKGAEVIKSNKLTNIRLINLADIEINEMTAELIRSKG
ncbi:MAG: hypothetical protein KA746_12305 [Pyrinomonadaceae bacterium]|nr:hypothetical protein [Pyrinomonadaceae bacterium]